MSVATKTAQESGPLPDRLIVVRGLIDQFRMSAQFSRQQESTHITHGYDAGRRIDGVQALKNEARARRFQNLEQVLVTGKGFWQVNDLEVWARRAHHMEKSGQLFEKSLLILEIPAGYTPPFYRRLHHLKKKEKIRAPGLPPANAMRARVVRSQEQQRLLDRDDEGCRIYHEALGDEAPLSLGDKKREEWRQLRQAIEAAAMELTNKKWRQWAARQPIGPLRVTDHKNMM